MIAASDVGRVFTVDDVLNVLGANGEPDVHRVQGMIRTLSVPQLAALDRQLRIVPESFGSYVTRVSPKFMRMKWLDDVIEHLQMLVDGTITRLMIEAPPRHGKSFVVSEHLPAYFLHRYPWKWCGLASHSMSLARGFSRRARQNYLKGGGALQPGSRAVDRWQTLEGHGDGGMWARGFDGGITGEGSGLLVIDDPVKSRKHIATPNARRKLGETWREVIYTRLESDGGVVEMATRWHDEDLTGQLIKAESDDLEMSEGWVLISRRAVRLPDEASRRKLPQSIRVIPDTRAVGEALASERGYTREKLQRIERVVGPATWWSLFQQEPRPMDGTQFKWDDFKIVRAGHQFAYRVRYWDLAKSEGENDYTAGALVSFAPGEPIPVIIEDVVSAQYAEGRRNQMILDTARKDAQRYGAHGVVIWIESLGKSDTRQLVAMLQGFLVESETAAGEGSKEVRLSPLASQTQVGNVGLIEAPWNGPFREQACAFPNGDHDDEIDAAGGAYNKLVQLAMRGEFSEEDFDVG